MKKALAGMVLVTALLLPSVSFAQTTSAQDPATLQLEIKVLQQLINLLLQRLESQGVSPAREAGTASTGNAVDNTATSANSKFVVNSLVYNGEPAGTFTVDANKTLDLTRTTAVRCYAVDDCTATGNRYNAKYPEVAKWVDPTHFSMNISGIGPDNGTQSVRPATFRITLTSTDGDVQYWHVTLPIGDSGVTATPE